MMLIYISFRILVKNPHNIAGHIDDPEHRFNR